MIIFISTKDKGFLRKVLSGKLILVFCFLAVALYNTFETGNIFDGGPPTFWIFLIVNPLLFSDILVKNENQNTL